MQRSHRTSAKAHGRRREGGPEAGLAKCRACHVAPALPGKCADKENSMQKTKNSKRAKMQGGVDQDDVSLRVAPFSSSRSVIKERIARTTRWPTASQRRRSVGTRNSGSMIEASSVDDPRLHGVTFQAQEQAAGSGSGSRQQATSRQHATQHPVAPAAGAKGKLELGLVRHAGKRETRRSTFERGQDNPHSNVPRLYLRRHGENAKLRLRRLERRQATHTLPSP